VNGNKAARALTGLAVLAVAVVVGIVSFTHIETLALMHGYVLGSARLLPVSVDGLIVASSLACLTEARARGEASRLSRAGLVLGILATLAANVAARAHFGIIGALVNAWSAVAFIFASEILLRMLRAARDVPSAVEAAGTVAKVHTVPVAVPATVADVVSPVPLAVPRAVPAAVPVDGVPPMPVRRSWTVTPWHTQAGRPKAPEKVFAAELAAGELPSVRAVKERCHVGTDHAREIQSKLRERLKVPEAA
jgi:hypothetical protein